MQVRCEGRFLPLNEFSTPALKPDSLNVDPCSGFNVSSTRHPDYTHCTAGLDLTHCHAVQYCSANPDQGRVEAKWSLDMLDQDLPSASDLDPRYHEDSSDSHPISITEPCFFFFWFYLFVFFHFFAIFIYTDNCLSDPLGLNPKEDFT